MLIFNWDRGLMRAFAASILALSLLGCTLPAQPIAPLSEMPSEQSVEMPVAAPASRSPVEHPTAIEVPLPPAPALPAVIETPVPVITIPVPALLPPSMTAKIAGVPPAAERQLSKRSPDQLAADQPAPPLLPEAAAIPVPPVVAASRGVTAIAGEVKIKAADQLVPVPAQAIAQLASATRLVAPTRPESAKSVEAGNASGTLFYRSSLR